LVGRESDENPDRRLEVRSAKRIERRVLETKELKKRSWGGARENRYVRFGCRLSRHSRLSFQLELVARGKGVVWASADGCLGCKLVYD